MTAKKVWTYVLITLSILIALGILALFGVGIWVDDDELVSKTAATALLGLFPLIATVSGAVFLND